MAGQRDDFSRLLQLNELDARLLSYGKARAALRYVAMIEALRPAGETVLELGCGAGGLSSLLDDYVGLDLDPELVTQARDLHTGARARFVCADAARTPFADRIAGLTVSCNMLEHMPSPAEGIAEMHRLTRSRALIIVPCRDQIPWLYDPINRWRVDHGRTPLPRGAFGYGHLNLLNRAEWVAMIEQAGFVVTDALPYDDSILTHLEFLAFSLLMNSTNYRKVPTGRMARDVYRKVLPIHRLLGALDLKGLSFSIGFVAERRD